MICVEIVAQIKPTNNLFEHQYQIEDNNLKAYTTIYYRLKMVEQGKSLFSNIQTIKIDKWSSNNNFSISPNPANTFVGLIANKIVADGNIIIKIYNEIGVEVISKNITKIGVGEKYLIPLTSLSNGNYFVNVFDVKSNLLLFKQQISVIK